MGKEQHKVQGSKTYILKFEMHCQCNGCVKKISEGVKEISLSEGVESADLSVETGEVEVTGRMDPEKLCCVLHEATKKCVKIVGQTEGIHVGETKNLSGQAPPATALEARDSSNAWWYRRGTAALHVVAPSAPPLPEEYEGEDAWRTKAVASERCWYRWSAPSSTPGVWSASDVTGTLAMYEL
ncbi:hypothetical protein BS78_04G321300 [Paspalum vaginatum]|nr:hypothetical protein BS78_04G321300 [Paspalum vaginatum]